MGFPTDLLVKSHGLPRVVQCLSQAPRIGEGGDVPGGRQCCLRVEAVFY